MWRNFLHGRVDRPVGDLVELQAQLPVHFQHPVEFLLLPVHYVAQVLDGALEVRELDLHRLEP